MLKSSNFGLEKTGLLKNTRTLYFLQVLLGACYLALLSQFKIPLTPVPITLHTFAIFTMGLYMGKNKAAYAALTYLAAATAGLPVFPGLCSKPLWFLGPTAGFCLSFPVAAYVIGAISESKQQYKLFWNIVSILAGQFVIYTSGVCWLAASLGFQTALAVGLYPFIPMAAMKLSAAVSMKMSTDTIRKFLTTL